MAEVTVADFAKVLKVPVDRLLVQLDEAGIKVGGADDCHQRGREARAADAPAQDARPQRRRRIGAAPITLNRKSSSEIKLGSSQGRARTVNVEVRQKRTYIKRDVLEEQSAQATGRARRGSPRRGGGSQRRRARGAG